MISSSWNSFMKKKVFIIAFVPKFHLKIPEFFPAFVIA